MWSTLAHALRRDTAWRTPDVFDEVAADPMRTDGHHRMLASYARHDYAAVPTALRLRGDERVVDAGGGLGVLASAMVAQYPQLRVLLLDRAEVIERAAQQELAPNIELRATDLFQPWAVEADAVVMARVLHDWDDQRAVLLLQHARQSLPAGGRLFVVEMLLAETDVAGSLCDLHLLAATGGAERTAPGYAKLLGAAGFDLMDVRRLPTLPAILEGVAR